MSHLDEVPYAEEEERRFGGPMADEEPASGGGGDDEAKRKAEERERKKAEVRKRLEEAGSKKKSKKGFLTPERKKKLRKLLMIKAAEDLKQQQLKREQERQSVLSSRVKAIPDVDTIEDKGKLESIYNELFQRMVQLEEEKYDINVLVSEKDAQINELTIAVNDLRGKFVKPALKKVSKYDNKFKKLAGGEKPAGEKADFRSQLKNVKRENITETLDKKVKKSDKPEWSQKGAAKKEAPAAPAKSEPEPEKEEKPAAEPAAEEPEEEEIDEEEEGEEEEE
ncbi:Troponin [Aphelenchoides fujianensis]|nr:Troponin [Aphelenchoides fujianensis]